MSFIPIIARADITENGSTPTATIKKGKITPSQMAQLNAWVLAKKTGILNCLNKCQATASTISSNKSTITFSSGYIVVCGRLIECESGTTVEINTLQYPNGKIVLSVDLSSLKEDEVKINVVSPSTVLANDDLNEKPLNGKYDFELYSYKTSGTTVTLTRADTAYVPDIEGKFLQFEENLVAEGKPLYNYDMSKGTIEERLTALGFRQGSVLGLPQGVSVSQNKIIRSGNYCILDLHLRFADNTILYDKGKAAEIINELDKMYVPEEFGVKPLAAGQTCFGKWTGRQHDNNKYEGEMKNEAFAVALYNDGTESGFTFQNFFSDGAPINKKYTITSLQILSFGYKGEEK